MVDAGFQADFVADLLATHVSPASSQLRLAPPQGDAPAPVTVRITSFSPSLSALTTNPEARKGLRPTTVLISWSEETSTGGRLQQFAERRWLR